ncbi:MAG: hypothetical protein CL596_07595, partial [Alteromonas sp.]|nr:hypothetical protein [Alteromonas sp.]
FFEETNQYISGFVISSDEAGNFFEEIIIQNNAENPTRGVKVLIDVNPLYTRYEVGRKVFVKLDGLTVGLNSGVLTLGFGGNGEDIEKISGPLEEEYIVRSNETATIVPTVKTLSQLSNRDLNTLIQLPNAQFTESELGLGFANQVGDQFDGDRTIESCSDDGGSILFQTSTFADFKGVSLPQGAGSLTAVFQKDFFGEVYSLAVRDLSDLDFSGNRCEPSLLNPGLEATTTFDAVYSRYNQEGGYVEFSEDEDELVIEGYVISSDEKGNFFEEIIIQNTPLTTEIGPNNPRLGLRVILNRGDIYQDLPVGRKVYIKLNGLAADIDSGSLTIGYPNVSEIVQLPEGVIDLHVVPGEEIAELIPLMASANELSEGDINTLVQLSNMQFVQSQLGLTFAGEPADEFDGERNLESCDETGDIRLFTSTFALFKSQLLPEASGTVTAVYTKDFFGEENILVVRDTEDFSFSGPRCDPIVFGCDGPSGGGSIFWSEDFEQFNAIEDYVTAGWTNVNVNGGSTLWVIGNFDGTNYAQISGFNSGEADIETWLVTPGIDMDNTTEEELTMDIQTSYDNGEILGVVFSTNFTGDVTTADWQALDVDIPTGPAGGFGTFVTVDPVNISCIEGTMYLAFVYRGSDPSATTRYHIDNIEITGN